MRIAKVALVLVACIALYIAYCFLEAAWRTDDLGERLLWMLLGVTAAVSTALCVHNLLHEGARGDRRRRLILSSATTLVLPAAGLFALILVGAIHGRL